MGWANSVGAVEALLQKALLGVSGAAAVVAISEAFKVHTAKQ